MKLFVDHFCEYQLLVFFLCLIFMESLVTPIFVDHFYESHFFSRESDSTTTNVRSSVRLSVRLSVRHQNPQTA